MQEIKLWSVLGDKVKLVNKEALDYENRLEKWILEDISILSDQLAVIGSQVVTAFGQKIDILAINSIGEVVIIELKRDKTYREVISQALDYATWVKDLSYDELNSIFLSYRMKQGKTEYEDLGEYFSNRFDQESEDIEFNSDHKMIIVGSEIDDSTKRIIDYLSNEPYSVNINAVNFNYFRDQDGKEFVAQSFVRPDSNIIEESKSKERKRTKSIISMLFEDGKLKPQQRLYLKPAIEQGVSRDLVCAEIVNTNQRCLKLTSEDTGELYSFSKLRRVLVERHNLQDVRKYWGFGVRFDWIDENNKNLVDLLNQEVSSN